MATSYRQAIDFSRGRRAGRDAVMLQGVLRRKLVLSRDKPQIRRVLPGFSHLSFSPLPVRSVVVYLMHKPPLETESAEALEALLDELLR
jgi:hypothetical protein